jgi:hypothetical protein
MQIYALNNGGWFPTRHTLHHRRRSRGRNTTPGLTYRRATHLVGDAGAWQSRLRACVQAQLINSLLCRFPVEEIADCIVVSVPKTCGDRQRFVHRLMLRVYSHETRVPNCHWVRKLPANPRWARVSPGHIIMRHSRRAGTRAPTMRTMRGMD